MGPEHDAPAPPFLLSGLRPGCEFRQVNRFPAPQAGVLGGQGHYVTFHRDINTRQGIAAAGGAVGMGLATAKSAESIARQPEAEGKVRTTLMLGLVFIETAIIYALLVVILIIFVL